MIVGPGTVKVGVGETPGEVGVWLGVALGETGVCAVLVNEGVAVGVGVTGSTQIAPSCPVADGIRSPAGLLRITFVTRRTVSSTSTVTAQLYSTAPSEIGSVFWNEITTARTAVQVLAAQPAGRKAKADPSLLMAGFTAQSGLPSLFRFTCTPGPNSRSFCVATTEFPPAARRTTAVPCPRLSKTKSSA